MPFEYRKFVAGCDDGDGARGRGSGQSVGDMGRDISFSGSRILRSLAALGRGRIPRFPQGDLQAVPDVEMGAPSLPTRVASKQELEDRIQAAIDDINRQPAEFRKR